MGDIKLRSACWRRNGFFMADYYENFRSPHPLCQLNKNCFSRLNVIKSTHNYFARPDFLPFNLFRRITAAVASIIAPDFS